MLLIIFLYCPNRLVFKDIHQVAILDCTDPSDVLKFYFQVLLRRFQSQDAAAYDFVEIEGPTSHKS